MPVAASHVDLWATEAVLDLAERENRRATVVLNRAKAGTRLAAEVAGSAAGLNAEVAVSRLANRVAYAESLGRGLGVLDGRRGAASAEVEALAVEVLGLLDV